MGEELDLAALRPDFRAWLFQAADTNFDRFEAVHGDEEATTAIIAELMLADVVYSAWEDHDSDGGFRFVVIKGRAVLSSEDNIVLCSVLPCASRETAMTIASEEGATLGELPSEGNA